MATVLKVRRIPLDVERTVTFDRQPNLCKVNIKEGKEDYTITLREENLSRPMEDILKDFEEVFLTKKDWKEALRGVEGWW